MDAGPIWATRTFPHRPRSRHARAASTTGPVADAAIELIREVVAKAADPAFVPEPLDDAASRRAGRTPAVDAPGRPSLLRGPTRSEQILRRIRAADGSPGVRTTLCGIAGLGVRRPPRARRPRCSRAPSSLAATAPCSSAPATAPSGSATSAVWPTTANDASSCRPWPLCGPAERRARVPRAARAPRAWSRVSADHLSPGRPGRRAVLRLLQRGHVHRAVPTAGRRPPSRRCPGHQRARRAGRRDLLQRHPPQRHRGGRPPGAGEAWRNINAIDDVCREIITCTTSSWSPP